MVKTAKAGIYIAPLDVAFILKDKNLGISAINDYLYDTWRMNKDVITSLDEKSFHSETLYWLDYLEDKKSTEAEIREIIKETAKTGHAESLSKLSIEDYQGDLFFKKIRLELTTEQKAQVRAKQSTVMKNYGYQRKTQIFMDYVSLRLRAFDITMYQSGDEVDIEDVRRDEMVAFRIEKQDSSCDVEWNESACIVSLCPPRSKEELIGQRISDGTDRSRILKAKTDFAIDWEVNRYSEAGDIVVFYCPASTEQVAERLVRSSITSGSSRIDKLLQDELTFYRENKDGIVAVGVISETPSARSRQIEITDIIWLDEPIMLSKLEEKIRVNRYARTTYVPADKWLEIRKEIKFKNPLMRI